MCNYEVSLFLLKKNKINCINRYCMYLIQALESNCNVTGSYAMRGGVLERVHKHPQESECAFLGVHYAQMLQALST